MKQLKKEKPIKPKKSILTFFYKITGPGIVGFINPLNDQSKTEIRFIDADSKISGKAG